MTKLEQLAQAAAALPDDQIDGLIAYAAYLAGKPLYYSATPQMLAAIDQGLDDLTAGRVIDGESVRRQAAARIAAVWHTSQDRRV